jgi:hypothetical protein
MNDMPYNQQEEPEELDEAEKLDQALHDVEMIYRSRCVDVPLTSNVTVTELDEEKKNNDSQSER